MNIETQQVLCSHRRKLPTCLYLARRVCVYVCLRVCRDCAAGLCVSVSHSRPCYSQVLWHAGVCTCVSCVCRTCTALCSLSIQHCITSLQCTPTYPYTQANTACMSLHHWSCVFSGLPWGHGVVLPAPTPSGILHEACTAMLSGMSGPVVAGRTQIDTSATFWCKKAARTHAGTLHVTQL